MTAYRAALDALAALPIPGVTTRCGLAALPDHLPADWLPALLVLPGDPYRGRGLFAADQTLETLTFSGAASAFTAQATHALAVLPADVPFSTRRHLPALVDLIDAYTAALAADLRLGLVLAAPARISVHPQSFEYGGALFHGCLFRHTWHIALP